MAAFTVRVHRLPRSLNLFYVRHAVCLYERYERSWRMTLLLALLIIAAVFVGLYVT